MPNRHTDKLLKLRSLGRHMSNFPANKIWKKCSRFTFGSLLLLLSCNIAYAKLVPYLQSPTESSIWVSWKTSSGNSSKVEYGLSADSLLLFSNGNTQALASDYLYHTTQLTHLQPDTTYFYRIITDNEVSDTYQFVTPPVKGDVSGHIRMLVMGDHQIRGENRYEQLVAAAKTKIEELYGLPIEKSINLVLNDGDQVDVGTLDHYENLHFAQSAAISPNVPIMTTVGNHEYYYDADLVKYGAHFIYDGYTYQGIEPASDESYYAYQIGRVLLIHMNSMRTDAAQEAWLRKVVNAGDADTSVDWMISVIHHPYQAEQYIGDISHKLRDSWMEILASSRKHVLNIAGHHHLYARGQTREWPIYHMISGGTAWDQYWGQSSEEDFDDVQKTIANWAWQIIDIDIASKKMTVETYGEAHPLRYKTEGFDMQSKLIDRFQRDLAATPPNKPSITNEISESITLPYTFQSTAFNSTQGDLINSTQYQIANDSEFKSLKVDKIRDYENIYGDTGAPLYEPVDLNRNVNILNWTVPNHGLPNGEYYLKTRHRSNNLEWSSWSDSVKFTVTGSTIGEPALLLSKIRYESGETVTVEYTGGYKNPKDWIGIYRVGQTPSSSSSSVKWQYVPNGAGVVNFESLADGEYFIAFFENNSYQEIASRVNLFIGAQVHLAIDKTQFADGETVTIDWQGASAGKKDWLGIYRVGQEPGGAGSTLWKYATTTDGLANFSGLGKGYYYATFMINDGYTEVSERLNFSVGTEITQVTLDKTRFEEGEEIVVMFNNGPGIPKDYMGIFAIDAIPGQTGSELISYLYFDGAVSGKVVFKQDNIPTGTYFVAMYTNDSYDQVSNRACFVVGDGSGCETQQPQSELTIPKASYTPEETIVLHWHNTPGNAKDWLGIYKAEHTPGDERAIQYSYLTGKTGSADFTSLAIGNYYAVIMLNDGYQEATQRVYFSVEAKAMAGDLNGDNSVTASDGLLLRKAFGKCEGTDGFLSDADLNQDGCINFSDYVRWLAIFRQQ